MNKHAISVHEWRQLVACLVRSQVLLRWSVRNKDCHNNSMFIGGALPLFLHLPLRLVRSDPILSVRCSKQLMFSLRSICIGATYVFITAQCYVSDHQSLRINRKWKLKLPVVLLKRQHEQSALITAIVPQRPLPMPWPYGEMEGKEEQPLMISIKTHKLTI
jgi:hypothetical protein